MPKSGQRAEVNTFIQGLITEASPLNFPPNASREEENFILKRDGTRHRRLGIDYVDGYELRNTSQGALIFQKAITSFKWTTVSGDPGLEFLAVQVAEQIYFFNISNPTTPDGYLGVVTTPFNDATKFSFASIEGRLVVAAGYETIAIVTYDTLLATFSIEEKVIKVRDFWGVQVP